MTKGTCSVDGCDLPVYGRSLCSPHWQRNRRWGSPTGGPRRPTERERFESKILRRASGCWEWAGSHFKETGYTIFNRKSRKDGIWRPTTGHTFSYETYVGQIPSGTNIDHLCRNRGCVNPEHLEAVTPQVNMLRSEAPSAISVRTNKCYRGHDFTPENTYTKNRDGRPKRECRECQRARERKRVRRRKD